MDPDLDPITFSKSGGGADESFFSITALGVLTFNSPPDFETPLDANTDGVYEVEIQADDGNGGIGLQLVMVTVTDVDEAPEITSDGGLATAIVNAAENQTAVTDVQSSDPEGETENGGGLTYSLTTAAGGGVDNGFFTLNTATGLLTFTSAPDFENPLDSDTDNDYEVQVTVTDSGLLTDVQDIAVTVTDSAPPTIGGDSYTTIGNVQLNVGATAPLTPYITATPAAPFANNSDPDSVLTAGSVTAAPTKGNVVLNSNGTFTYQPNAGATGADSFTYKVLEDGGDEGVTETINLTIGNMIWFIDKGAGGANLGTSSNPFTSMASYNASGLPAAGDTIFVHTGKANYTSGISLLNSQLLHGEGTAFSEVDPNTAAQSLTIAAGTRPTLTTASGHAIALASGNTVRGLNIGTTSGTGIFGTSVGTSTVSDVSITGNGAGVNITTGTLAMSFDEISSSNAAGITLSSVGGDFDVTTGTINSGTSTAVNISGIPLDLGVTLTSVSASGAANGIVLNNTTGSFTVTGDGSTATQGGNDSGGVIQNITGDGIVLTDTTGITLRNMTIGDTAATPANSADATTNIGDDGVHATNVTDLGLFNVTIARTGTHGVRGINVTNFTFDDSLMLNAGDDQEENGLDFTGLFGDNFVTDSLFDAFNESASELINASGQVDLTVDNTTFQDNQATVGNAGEEAILIVAQGDAQIVALITGTAGDPQISGTTSIFNQITSQAVQAISEGASSDIQLTIENSRLLEFGSGALPVGDAVIIFNTDNAGSGNITVKNNFITDTTLGPFAILLKNDSSGLLEATVQSNIVTNMQMLNINHDNIGSGGAANGTTKLLIGGPDATNDKNTVTPGSDSYSIDLIATETGPASPDPDVHATILNNGFDHTAQGTVFGAGIRLDVQNDTRMNADIQGNSVTGAITFFATSEYRILDQAEGRIEGLIGDPTTFLTNANPGLPNGMFANDSSTGSFTAGNADLPTATTQPSPLLAIAESSGAAASSTRLLWRRLSRRRSRGWPAVV